jgi:hypothetical protein
MIVNKQLMSLVNLCKNHKHNVQLIWPDNTGTIGKLVLLSDNVYSVNGIVFLGDDINAINDHDIRIE